MLMKKSPPALKTITTISRLVLPIILFCTIFMKKVLSIFFMEAGGPTSAFSLMGKSLLFHMDAKELYAYLPLCHHM